MSSKENNLLFAFLKSILAGISLRFSIVKGSSLVEKDFIKPKLSLGECNLIEGPIKSAIICE
jgi:hypothetical protein